MNKQWWLVAPFAFAVAACDVSTNTDAGDGEAGNAGSTEQLGSGGVVHGSSGGHGEPCAGEATTGQAYGTSGGFGSDGNAYGSSGGFGSDGAHGSSGGFGSDDNGSGQGQATTGTSGGTVVYGSSGGESGGDWGGTG